MPFSPLITFPRAVFLKNLRCVTTASDWGRFLIVIFCSDMVGRWIERNTSRFGSVATDLHIRYFDIDVVGPHQLPVALFYVFPCYHISGP